MVTVLRSYSLLFLLALAVNAAPARYRTAAGLDLTVTPDGFFSIASVAPPWTFAGSIGAPISQITPSTGSDGAGLYQKISFSCILNGTPTTSSIRVYENRPIAVFSTTLLAPEPNRPLFPHISTYPQTPYQFSFSHTYLYQYGTPLGPQNSSGMVGIGDAMGAEVPANLAQVVRPDGIIVKPDRPMVPLDSTYIADAQAPANQPPPMVAYSRSPRAAYVFAYSHSAAAAPIHFAPADLGLSSAVYVYNYFAKTGELISENQSFLDTVSTSGSYYIVAPVGSSGIALLGDANKFVSLGRQRFASIEDRGTLNVALSFASGESSVTIQGYSPKPLTIAFTAGSLLAKTYDPSIGIFTLTIAPTQNQGALSLQ